jgi:peptide/nickel transport system ATP-binding protein
MYLGCKKSCVHYEVEDGTVQAVNGIDLRLERKRSIGLVGETGAGKTSTALALRG